MIAFLRGVPGKLKTITDYLTTHVGSARMAFLDAAISTRAPSSTALSNATWDGTKAGYLDAAVSTRAVASPVLVPPIAANFGAGSSSTSSATYTSVLSITGSGTINAIGAIGHATSGSAYLQVIIDGITVATDFQANSGQSKNLIGSGDGGLSPVMHAFDQIPFKTSLVINLHTNTVNAVGAFWILRRAT